MVEYEIYLNNAKRVYNWILTQPNLISIHPFSNDKIYCEFTHNAAEQTKFKEDIMERLFEVDIGNNTFEFLFNQLRQIKTDQLFFATESPVTKTNIGTTYVNIYTDFGGRPFFIDTTGFNTMAIQILWSRGAAPAGVHNMRIINDADSTQIVESGSLGLTANSDDFPNVSIPPAFKNFKGKWRLQGKSTVATDDPIFSGFRLYLRR